LSDRRPQWRTFQPALAPPDAIPSGVIWGRCEATHSSEHLASSVVRAWVRVGVAAAVAALAVVARETADARTNGHDRWADASAVAGFAILLMVLISPLVVAPVAKQAWQLLRHQNRWPQTRA
jgi:hypothetical protein